MSEPGDELDDLPLDEDQSPPPPTVPGWLVIVVLLVIAFLAAGGAWLYHLSTQRRPVDYWGFDSHRIMADADTVMASMIEREPPPKTREWHDSLFMIGEERYVVDAQKSAKDYPGFKLEKDQPTPLLRKLLREDDSYDWDGEFVVQPTWHYALSFHKMEMMYKGTDHEEMRPFSFTLVFDAECRYVRLQMVDNKTAVLKPHVAAEFAKFFRTTFPDRELPLLPQDGLPTASPTVPAPASTAPTATATGTSTGPISISGPMLPLTTPTASASAMPTSTAMPAATSTPTGAATPTGAPTATSTSTATPTTVSTVPAPAMATPIPSAAPSATAAPVPTASPTVAPTPTAKPTASVTVVPAPTAVPTPTSVPAPTATTTPSATGTANPFKDLPSLPPAAPLKILLPSNTGSTIGGS